MRTREVWTREVKMDKVLPWDGGTFAVGFDYDQSGKGEAGEIVD